MSSEDGGAAQGAPVQGKTSLPHSDAVRIEAQRWRDAGLVPRLWWRDDDLTVDTAAFRTLASLSAERSTACLVSVIPEPADRLLADIVAPMRHLRFAQHGFAHVNHEPAGQPKNEFGAGRPGERIDAEIRQGLAKLRAIFGTRLLPVFVGPWNRCAARHAAALVDTGFEGWSGYSTEPCRPDHPALSVVDCHVDIVQWKVNPTLGDTDAIMARLVASLAREREAAVQGGGTRQGGAAAVGVLTHHIAMDPPCWAFMRALMDLAAAAGLSWADPLDLFQPRAAMAPLPAARC